MKAAIIGAGAIGGFYGAALADAGMDVSFHRPWQNPHRHPRARSAPGRQYGVDP